MIKEWMTVLSWHQGIATVGCAPRRGCSGCGQQESCGIRIVNELGEQPGHVWQIAVSDPLEAGQKVEIGLIESSLLRSAFLIYIVPLIALFLGAILFEWGFDSDPMALLGALIGGIVGFWGVRYRAAYLTAQPDFQPVLLQIGLPPSQFC